MTELAWQDVPEPDAPTLAWVARCVGGTSAARVVRRLAGGTHASTQLVRIGEPATEVVLRRYPRGDDAAAREARVLRALGGLGGLAPRLLGVDADGSRTGFPATLLSRLPGSADITSIDPYRIATGLGRALATVHATPTAPLTGFRDVLADGAARARPAAHVAARTPTGAAARLVTAGWDRLAGAPRVLTHRDYWAGNVLWQRGALTGVVDWSGAALAPRGVDVAWCRLDLILLHGPEVADAFRTAYEASAGAPVADLLLFDLHALVCSADTVETWTDNYQDLGRTDLVPAELRTRHQAWLHTRLAIAQP